MNNNIVKSITDVLDFKAPASDGLSSLQKNDELESKLNFSLKNYS